MRNNTFLALATVFLLAILVAFPFLVNTGLPALTDVELHIFRIAEMGYAIEEGTLYPRWAPDFYHGYGYPIFNYYAPLTYHLGYYLTLGNPENAAIAAKSLLVSSIFIGAYGAFYLGKYYTTQGGGLVGSAAFCFTPYIQLINPHSRGDLAEVVALAFLPWTLLYWQKVWRQPKKSSMFWAVVFSSLTLLSHNLTGLAMLGIVLGMALWEWCILKNRRYTKYIFITGLIFVFLTAFFWLPFLIERKEILLDVAGDGHYDFHNHFVRLGELLSSTKRFDFRDATMSIPFSAGPINILLGCCGGIASLFLKKYRINLYFLFSIILFFMITSLSTPVWEYLPGLAYFQFPWRFLGPLAVTMVPIIAYSTEFLSQLSFIQRPRVVKAVVSAAVVVIIIIFALPGLYPIPWESGFSSITRNSIIQAELEGRWRGTTSTNDFIPASVDMIPKPSESLMESYRNPPVDRINRYTLPERTVVAVLGDQPNHFDITTDESFILRLMLFYFPGWHAYLDGTDHPIEIAHPEGFITVNIPQGKHEVLVRFENTTSRSIGWWLSTAGLIIGVGGLCFSKIAEPISSPFSEISVETRENDRSIAPIFIVVVIILSVNQLIFKPGQTLYYESEKNTALPANQQMYVEYGEQIALIGYDITGNRYKAGQTFEIQLYWQATQTITQTFQSFIHIMDTNGQILTQSDHLNPGGYPTNLWTTDKYIRDKHIIKIPASTTLGTYPINVGLYSITDNIRLHTVDQQTGEYVSFKTLSDNVEIRR